MVRLLRPERASLNASGAAYARPISPLRAYERNKKMTDELCRRKVINGCDVFVTKLHGDGEQGQYHVVVANNRPSKQSDCNAHYHTGDRQSCEQFIKDNVPQSRNTIR